MSRTPSPLPVRPVARAGRRGWRALVAATAGLGLVLAGAGCAEDNQYQTERAYTPVDGVNVDVGDLRDINTVVYVRDLLLLSRGEGAAIVSATVITDTEDALTGVTGRALRPDGTEGAAFTAALTTPVPITPRAPVVLTQSDPLVVVESPELRAGLSAQLTLQFRRAGQVTATVLVMDGNLPQYASITPAASPAATPSGQPSAETPVTAAPTPGESPEPAASPTE